MAGQARLVAGVDSLTQATKVVVRQADTGVLVGQGRASHPEGTEVDPAAWEQALEAATAGGLLDEVAAVSGPSSTAWSVWTRPARWSARPCCGTTPARPGAAVDLIGELGGPQAWPRRPGSVASFTVAKLRWLATSEPGQAERTAAVLLPHDWLSWRLAGAPDLDALATDRGDASGTGSWSPATGGYRPELLELAFGQVPQLPRVLGPAEPAGHTEAGALLGPGTGDNMAATLGLGVGARPGDVVVSVGTSGTVFAVSDQPSADASGIVAGFADATGRFLPLVCTLDAARVLSPSAALLGVDLDGLDDLALAAPPGAQGLVLVPGSRASAPLTAPPPPPTWLGCGCTPPPWRIWPEPRSRAWCAGWPMAWTPSAAKAWPWAGCC